MNLACLCEPVVVHLAHLTRFGIVPTANVLNLVTRPVLQIVQLMSATTGCHVSASTNLHATALPPLVTPASSSMQTAFVKRVMLRIATLATNGLQPLANARLLPKSQLSAILPLKRTAANRASFLLVLMLRVIIIFEVIS